MSKQPGIRINHLALIASLSCAVMLSSCKSSGGKGGSGSAPRWDPSGTQNIMGSTATPPHSLPRNEYPFDAQGNYVSAWVREGASTYGHSTSPSASATHSYKPSRPSSSPSSSSQSKKSTTSYSSHTVAAGDTLYSLSRKYGTTVAAIKSANGMSSDTIVNGRTLKIPK